MSYRCHCGCEELRKKKLQLSDKRAYEVGTNLTIMPVDQSCGLKGGYYDPLQAFNNWVNCKVLGISNYGCGKSRNKRRGRALGPRPANLSQEQIDANNRAAEERRLRVSGYQ